MGSRFGIAAGIGALVLVGAGVVGAAASGIDDAAAAGRAAVRLDPPAVDAPAAGLQAAQAAAEQVNRERAARGLAPLVWQAQVVTAASAHASDMAAMRRMQHAGSDGSNAGDRLTRAGYVWSGWGENVAAGYTDPVAVVAAWMASPGHRAQMLGDFTHVGIAVAQASDGTSYWALVAAR